MQKTIILDLDGTLLNSKKQIDGKTLSLLRELTSTNNIVLASGRHYRDMKTYANAIGEKTYCISCDGQYIHDGGGSLLWQNDFLQVKKLCQLLDELKAKKYTIVTDETDFYMIKNMFNRCLRQLMCKALRSKHTYIAYKEVCWLKKVEKVIVPGKITEVQKNILENEFCVHNYEDKRIYEILGKKVNKFYAIKQLCAMSNWEMEKTIFVGDDMNDYECFRLLPCAVAMGNAPNFIKNMAIYVTTDNDNEGVYCAIKRYI